ncbi:MAG: hypothetical protein PHH04_03685 [Thomasclavelia sp.]|nr:hypothetical protein [Thomasclavelia sp.]
MPKDLIISDQEYLASQQLVNSYMNKLLEAMNEYVKIIKTLVEDGIEDEKIKKEIINLGKPFKKVIKTYNDIEFMDSKMKEFIQDIDELDKFLY